MPAAPCQRLSFWVALQLNVFAVLKINKLFPGVSVLLKVVVNPFTGVPEEALVQLINDGRRCLYPIDKGAHMLNNHLNFEQL